MASSSFSSLGIHLFSTARCRVRVAASSADTNSRDR
jgi:hypothetical protein